jgi:hypothetical protein
VQRESERNKESPILQEFLCKPKTRMQTTKFAHYSKTDNSEFKNTKLMKYLKVLDKMKWQTGSDTCFGCDPTRILCKFFKMIPETVQQCAHDLSFYYP